MFNIKRFLLISLLSITTLSTISNSAEIISIINKNTNKYPKCMIKKHTLMGDIYCFVYCKINKNGNIEILDPKKESLNK